MLKYTIKNYATPTLINQIIEQLGITRKTYYTKVNATIDETQGFEALDLLRIGKILNRPADSLITPEAKEQILNS